MFPCGQTTRREVPSIASTATSLGIAARTWRITSTGVLVIPLSIPQPRRGSFVTSGSDGSSDEGGHVTLDVDPGGSTFYALPPFANAGEFVVGPAVTVDSGAVEPAEIRVP